VTNGSPIEGGLRTATWTTNGHDSLEEADGVSN